jgi:hypothetical protein
LVYALASSILSSTPAHGSNQAGHVRNHHFSHLIKRFLFVARTAEFAHLDGKLELPTDEEGTITAAAHQFGTNVLLRTRAPAQIVEL